MGLAQTVAERIAEALSPLPAWLVVAIAAMFPVAELRGAIPIGLLVFHWHWAPTLLVAAAANLLVVPVLWWALPYLERAVRRVRPLARILDRVYERTRRRTRRSVENYEELALFLVVALPLPGTGAWTGALVAYLFDLPYRKSLIVIGAGVVIAAAIVTLAVEAGIGLWGP